jgi:hypothetical protein
MLGYADEDKTTVLELTYNYGVTEYSKGNAYAQVSMKSLSGAFFSSCILAFLNCLADVSAGCHWHQ